MHNSQDQQQAPSVSISNNQSLDPHSLNTFHDQISAIMDQKDVFPFYKQLFSLLQEINTCPSPNIYLRDPAIQDFFLSTLLDEKIDHILNYDRLAEYRIEDTLISCLEQIIILWSKSLQETHTLLHLAKKILDPTCKFFVIKPPNTFDSDKEDIYADCEEGRQNLTYFIYLVNTFGAQNGFEDLCKRIVNIDNPVSIETITEFCSILTNISIVFHKEFADQYIPRFIEAIWNYLRANQESWVAASKKESIQIILKAFHTLLASVSSILNKQAEIEKYKLELSGMYLNSQSSQSKFQGLILILGVIRGLTFNVLDPSIIDDFLTKNEIFNKIFACFDSTLFIAHSPTILEYMCKRDILTLQDLQRLWNIMMSDAKIQLAIWNGIFESPNVSLKIEFFEYALEKLVEAPIDVITRLNIDLVTIIYMYCEKSEGLVSKYLRFYWHILLNEAKTPALGKKRSEQICLYINAKEMTLDQAKYFLNKSIDKLDLEDFMLASLHFVKSLLDIYPTAPFDNEKKLFEHTIKALTSTGRDTFMLIKLIELLLSLRPGSGLSANFDVLSIMWNITVLKSSSDKLKAQVFKSIKAIVESKNGLDIETEDLIRFLRDKMSYKDETKLSIEEFDCFISIFMAINENKKNISEVMLIKATGVKNFPSRFDKLVKIFVDDLSLEDDFDFAINTLPCNLEGADVLWSLAFTLESKKIDDKIQDLLAHMYVRISPNHEFDVREAQLEYFNKCFMRLEEILTQRGPKGQYLRVLTMIQRILDKSDQLAYVPCPSHSSLSKGNLLPLVVEKPSNHWNIYENMELEVYSNTSVFNLFARVAKRFRVQASEIYLVEKKQTLPIKINGTQNNQTLFDVGMKDYSFLFVEKISLPRVYLIEPDGTLNPKLQKVFKKWFETYSDNGKMSPEHFASFIHSCTEDECKANNARVRDSFDRCASNRDCYLTLDNFLSFYLQCCSERPYTVFDNLERMGERVDLKDRRELDRNQLENSPHITFLISSNEGYLKMLFSLLESTEEEIAIMALSILNRMPTNPQIVADIVLLKGVRGITNSEERDWSYVLDIKYPYKLFYSVNIIEYLTDDRYAEQDDATKSVTNIIKQDLALQNYKEVWFSDFCKCGGMEYLENIRDIIEKVTANALSEIYKQRIGLLIDDLYSQKTRFEQF